MRKYNKFKSVSRFYVYPYFFQNRIFRFKRPKWVIAQKKILNLSNQLELFKQFKKSKLVKIKINILKTFFFNFGTIKSKTNSWQRLRFFFKETLLMKNTVRKYFDGQFSLSFFKKIFKKNRIRSFSFASIFIKPEFRLDILLWRLKIFSSVYLVKQAIRNKQVFVNRKNINFDFYLKKGDVINFFQNKKYNLKQYFQKYFKVIFIPSFVELDFYTNTIIILKNFNNFKADDFSSLIKEPLCLYKFKNYILK